MSQPVTSNPLIIMFINMTVVFLVLIALGLVINLIHYLDPTRAKSKKSQVAPVATVSAKKETPAKANNTDEVSQEIVAAITAALMQFGYTASHIHAIHPAERAAWKQSGHLHGVHLG